MLIQERPEQHQNKSESCQWHSCYTARSEQCFGIFSLQKENLVIKPKDSMFEDVLRLFSCNLAKCTGDKEFTNHLTANWRLFVQPTWENVKDKFDNLKNSSIRGKTT